MSQSNGNTIVAILAGVALGATAGILFAPDKGTNTRKKIKSDFDDAKDKFSKEVDSAKKKFKGKYSTTKHDVEGSYDDLLNNLSHKAEDAISFLEQKLSALKSQATKYQK